MKVVFVEASLKELKEAAILTGHVASTAASLSNWRLSDIFKPRKDKDVPMQ